jgi:hypothetical protein
MNVEEAKALYQKVIKDRSDKEYLKIIDDIKKGINQKQRYIDVKDISKYVIDLLKEDGYKIEYNAGDPREPESYYIIKGWVN